MRGRRAARLPRVSSDWGLVLAGTRTHHGHMRITLLALLGAAGAVAALAFAPGCTLTVSPLPDEAGAGGGGVSAPDGGSDATTDAADGAVARCELATPFASVSDLGAAAASATLRSDELEMFAVDASGALSRSTRTSIGAPFGVPEVVDMPVPAKKMAVHLAADGLRLYLTAFVRTGNEPGDGHPELFTTTRASLTSAFAPPTALSLKAPVFNVLNTPHVTTDGASLFFTAAGGGSTGVFKIALPSGTMEDARALGNEVFVDPRPVFTRGNVLTGDGLHMYTSVVEVNGGAGGPKDGTGTLALAARASASDKFGTPVLLSSPAHVAGTNDLPQWLSPDQCRLYYVAGDGAAPLKVASRTP